MAAYDLEEQEQIDELKAWWKQYGNLITNVALAAALAVAAWQGWNWYQRSQAAQASMVFNVLQQAVNNNDTAKIKIAAGELTEKFGGTTQAQLGALLAARASFDAGDLKTARLQLGWAVDHAKNEVKDLARLNLAAVLLDDKAYDEALKQLEGASSPAFAARFAETKGDVLLAQGKKAEARTAYQAALKSVDAAAGEKPAEEKDAKPLRNSGPAREILQQKIDSLAGAA